uniref:Uncharacterized protein n=1 Tax=uncultured bacterium AOCefta2 TaxID=654977 RepID=D6MLW4_9BACT|nr:hypothetical protein WISOIL_0015 [uncultured bacterium AOCefta2]
MTPSLGTRKAKYRIGNGRPFAGWPICRWLISKSPWRHAVKAIVALCIVAGSVSSLPGAPSFNYQAKLTDLSGAPLTGVHAMFFSVFSGGSAGSAGSGTLVFSEVAGVTLNDGVADHVVGTGANLYGGALTPDSFNLSANMYLQVAVDSAANVVLPRTLLVPVPFAIKSFETVNAIKNQTSTYVATQVTTSAVTNGANLLAAYAIARVLTPNGQSLSATNRSVVLVAPGRYDLTTGQLTLNTDFVDLVGLSTAREDQYIFSATNGTNTGVLRQTANDVRIENLLVQSTRSSGGAGISNGDPAAYFPNTSKPATVIRNCEFRDDGGGHSHSMRVAITYEGTFIDCKAGDGSFGGEQNGIASGTFTNCSGGDHAFGGNGGSASGTFTNCTAGLQAFGAGTGLGDGSATGIFNNCIGGSNSFGGTSAFSTGARLYGCRMTGTSWASTFSGRMENCFWGTGFTCSNTARIYGSIIAGTLDLNSTAAGVTGTRAKDIIDEGSNTFGATSAAAFNLEDASVD